MMYHYYQTHYKMHNTNTHIHVRNKTMLFVNFITHCSYAWNKNFKISSNKWKLSIFIIISLNISNKIFQSLKDLKENDDISFFKYLNSLNLNESTYILSLKSKLTKLQLF
jgi:hypothetical protein